MKGFTLWFTGLPCSGKTTLSQAVAQALVAHGAAVEVLDGDEVRAHLSSRLGFSRQDRDLNVRQVGYVCSLLSRHGVAAIAALISPYRASREAVRQGHAAPFVEVFVDCPVEVCAARDVKGHYARARRGELVGFTGVDDPYEAPTAPDLTCHTDRETPEQGVTHVLDLLRARGLLPSSRGAW